MSTRTTWTRKHRVEWFNKSHLLLAFFEAVSLAQPSARVSDSVAKLKVREHIKPSREEFFFLILLFLIMRIVYSWSKHFATKRRGSIWWERIYKMMVHG